MKTIPVDVDEIICEYKETWLHHQFEAKPFMHLIEGFTWKHVKNWKRPHKLHAFEMVCATQPI